MPRAPFQVLIIPYTSIADNNCEYYVFLRIDTPQHQFIAGGGEEGESHLQVALRELREEVGIRADALIQLKSLCHITTHIFSAEQMVRWAWRADTYTIPEHTFAAEVRSFSDITLSNEHTLVYRTTYAEALRLLTWDSNKTALHELDCMLHKNKSLK